MRVEVWSDVVCPWCYLGKRRFETALAGFERRDEVEVVWRSFELDRHAPRRREGDPTSHLAAKYGISRQQALDAQRHLAGLARQAGLDYRLEHLQPGNSFDAHRLIHLAAGHGQQDTVVERLFAAYFVETQPIGEPETLARLATEAGLDATEVRAALEGDAYAEEVRADEGEASALGITGVPFFAFDRAFGVSGAQTPDVLLQALREAGGAGSGAGSGAGGAGPSTAARASVPPAGRARERPS